MTAFRGLLAYPITPLTDDDAPDLDALGRLVRDAAGAGVDGVVVLASSGAGSRSTRTSATPSCGRPCPRGRRAPRPCPSTSR
ncbi:hypothetical protein B8281_09570 [Cellulosimicrobium sp. TH-20]|nr:hypothetical protein B8281_09570 [Cellulosimicrobium sp. TH-20]